MSVVLSSSTIIRLLRTKEAQAIVPLSSLPQIIDCDDTPRKRSHQQAITYVPPTPEMLAYVDFSVTTARTLAGVKVGADLLLLLFFQ